MHYTVQDWILEVKDVKAAAAQRRRFPFGRKFRFNRIEIETERVGQLGSNGNFSEQTDDLNMECFHMTSRRPCWCPKLNFWELNSIFMQILPFVSVNQYGR